MEHWQEEFEGIKRSYPQAFLRPATDVEKRVLGGVAEDLFSEDLIIRLAHLVYASELTSHDYMVKKIDAKQTDEGQLVYADYVDLMTLDVLQKVHVKGIGTFDVFRKDRRGKTPIQLIKTLRVFFLFREAQIRPHKETKRFDARRMWEPLGICMIINGTFFAASVQTVAQVIESIKNYGLWVRTKPESGWREKGDA